MPKYIDTINIKADVLAKNPAQANFFKLNVQGKIYKALLNQKNAFQQSLAID